MTEIRKPKQCPLLRGFGHAQRRRLRSVLNIGIWNLFVIRCLEFMILDTKLQGPPIRVAKLRLSALLKV